MEAMHPKMETRAISHHAKPTMPMSRPYPYQDPEKMGPIVRKADDTDCPMPWIVPSTDGCGEQLFSRMMEVGRVKVRAVTWRKSTTMMEIQTHTPVACAGGGDEDGARERYGANP